MLRKGSKEWVGKAEQMKVGAEMGLRLIGGADVR